MEASLPRLVSVMNGPVAMLLTNADGFSSDFTMTFEDEAEHPVTISGWIVADGGKVRLDVGPVKSSRKTQGDAGFGVVWDAAAGQGYAFSEALQGYAPIGGPVHFTNVLTEVVESEPDRIEGHPAEKVNAMVLGDDGERITFQLLRAQDMGDLPLQVCSPDRPHSFMLTLSKIQPATPQEDLFLPPDGFTKYDSEPALITELAIRQQGMIEGGRSRPADWGSFDTQQGISGPGNNPH